MANPTDWVADFECTTNRFSETKSQMYSWSLITSKLEMFQYGASSMSSFFDALKSSKARIVWFHNLGYDGNFMFKWLLENGHKYSVNELQPGEWSWLNTQGVIYSIKLNWEGHVIEFLDSYKVLGSSVDALGKALGMPKDNLDYHKYTYFKSKHDIPNGLLKYMKRDVVIVARHLEEMKKVYDKKMTAAGIAYSSFKKFYGTGRFRDDFGDYYFNSVTQESEFRGVLTHDEWLFIDRGYSGGYVNWKKDITNKKISVENGVFVDVNSLYPATMKDNKIIYGKPLYYEPECDSAQLLTIHIIKARSKSDKYPPLFKQKGVYGKKYKHNVDNEEIVIWKEKLDFMLKYYDIEYVVLKSMWFKKKYAFKEWVSRTKHLKENAITEPERAMHKRILNSLYGKFGQKINVMQRHIVRDRTPVSKRRKGQSRYGKNKEFIHKDFATDSDALRHVGVSSYIAMRSLLTLWDAIFNNIDIWLYSDTDSCAFSRMPNGMKFDSREFGAWKPEVRFSEFKVLRSKCYIYTQTHKLKDIKHGIIKWKKEKKIIKKISGLSKVGKDKVTYDNFYLGSVIKLGKRGKVNVDGGLLLVDRDYTLGKVV